MILLSLTFNGSLVFCPQIDAQTKRQYMPSRASTLPAERASVAARSATTRSRSTNDVRHLPGVDGRSSQARRFRDVVAGLSGDGELGEAETVLVRSIATLTVRAETMSAAMIRGEATDPEQLTRVTNALARMLGALGKARPAKVKAPSLSGYLANRHEAPPQ